MLILIWVNTKKQNFINSFKRDKALAPVFSILIGRILQKTGSSDALKHYKQALIGSIKDTDPLNNIGTFLFEKNTLLNKIL